MTFEKEKREAIALAHLAGAIMLHYYGGEYQKWEKEDAAAAAEAALTEVDLTLDRVIRTVLAALWPADALLTEETDAESGWHRARRIWICDPLDGTLGFIKQTGCFGFSLALVENGKPVVGVLHAPALAWTAWAAAGEGAFFNGKEVNISGSGALKKLIISSNSWQKPDYRTVAEKLGNPEELRLESVVVKVLKLLAGEGELYLFVPESKKSPSVPKFWDIAAADIIVREAGGRATDFRGEEYRYDRADFRCRQGALFGAPEAHRYALARLNGAAAD